ncbi:MAG: hypothetical protein WAO58_11970 [Fimbriimonadaceae bacterium]
MRMLLTVHIPHEPFNTLVREKKVGEIMGRILEDIKPEAAYFSEQNGTRCGTFVVHVSEASQIPSFAEPFFLNFEADCEFRVAMTPEDLAQSGLDSLGEKWG